MSPSLTYSAAGHWRDALELWEWAIKRERWGWISYFYHGQLLLAHGDSAAALVDFEEVIVRGGKGPWVYFHLELAHAAMGNFAAALEPCRQAIAQPPSVTLFHQELARAYEELGRKTESEQERQIAQKLMSGGTSGTQTRP